MFDRLFKSHRFVVSTFVIYRHGKFVTRMLAVKFILIRDLQYNRDICFFTAPRTDCQVLVGKYLV